MLITLKLNKEKVEAYNKRVAEFKQEHPDMADAFTEVHQLEDVFIPYADVTHENYKAIEEDYRYDYDGVYACGLNSNHDVVILTDYTEKRNFDSPIYWYDYGVCDNASQVLDYYDSLYKKHKDYMENNKFVILLTPIIKEHQPEDGGWRWYKWGQYIGKFEPKCEYLYDEQGIDYVWVFKILEIEECDEEELT